jgi:cell division protein FtsA
MPKGHTLNAIDIGSSKMTCLITVVSEDGEKVHVVGASTTASRGVRKGQIVNIEEVVNSATECVESAERMAGFNIDSAYVSLNGEHIDSQNSQGLVAVPESEDSITSEDIARVIEASRAVTLPSSREIVHVIPREYIVDGQRGIKDPTGMSGIRLETDAHLVTALSPAVKNIHRCINDLTIDVSGLVYTGLASAEAVLTDTEKELGVVLVDIGGGTTSISVFIEGACAFSTVIPIGAKKITDDLAIGLTISLDSAERIKHHLSQLPTSRSLEDKPKDELDLTRIGVREDIKNASRKTIIEGMIRPRLNEIFTMVATVLKRSGYAGQTPAGVVITGGGALTVGISESARRVLQLPPRIGTPSGLYGLTDEINSPVYATAVGLVLHGLHQKPHNRPGNGKLTSIFRKVPGGDIVSKAVEFIKSFLP